MNKVNTADKRKSETEEERESRLKKDKVRTANRRQRPVSMYARRIALNVLNSHQIVPVTNYSNTQLVLWTLFALIVQHKNGKEKPHQLASMGEK